MTPFIPKKIRQIENMGEELRLARNEKKLNIDEVASIIKIRKEYLLALEMEDFNKLPSGLYGKNYLKKYAHFLNIDNKRINLFLEQLSAELEDSEPFSTKVIDRKKFIIFPKIIRSIAITLAVLAFFLYLLFYFKNLIVAPQLEISYPSANMMTSENSLEIVGKADPGSELSINEETILLNEHGDFKKLVNLKKGINTITISAKKKYSRENIIIRQILVD